MEMCTTQIDQTVLKRRNKTGRLTILNFKFYYKTLLKLVT